LRTCSKILKARHCTRMNSLLKPMPKALPPKSSAVCHSNSIGDAHKFINLCPTALHLCQNCTTNTSRPERHLSSLHPLQKRPSVGDRISSSQSLLPQQVSCLGVCAPKGLHPCWNYMHKSSDAFWFWVLSAKPSWAPHDLHLMVNLPGVMLMQGNHTLSSSLVVPRAEVGGNRGVSSL
jgi:hypothetical protein